MSNTTKEILISKIKVSITKGGEFEKESNSNLSKSIIQYRNIGEFLIELQKQCKKDGITFHSFVEENIGFKERQSQRYMKLYNDKRTKNVGEDYFKDMINPTFTKVVNKLLPLTGGDYDKVLGGNDSPLIKTDDEKEKELKDVFDSKSFNNITFEQYKIYVTSSKPDLIKIIDDTVSMENEKELVS